ncbi:MAG: lamin tail domain-containing protein [Clostridia bacterium]|nr:lamin tail domain-containing protein [Clostridia bacterium]MDD4679437.1 lamin tail domain-containing protein [Clostridia bacterium]
MTVKFTKITSFAFTLLLLLAALTGVLTSCSPAGTRDNDLVINEVVSSNSNSLSVPDLGSPDWIEIYNRGSNDINMNGYILRNSSKPSTYYVFPDIVIKAGDYLVIYACSKPRNGLMKSFCSGYKLPKKGVGLVLYDANLRVLDEVEVPALETDISWCRADKGFKYCTTPTPGSENTGNMADSLDELMIESVTAPSGLVLNEATADWVEIYNGSREAVNLSSYYLSDSPSNLTRWRFPDVELLPDTFIVTGLKNDIGDFAASFRVASDEDAVYFSTGSEIIGSLQVNNLYDNISIGLDASGKIAYFPDITPGEMNSDVSFYSLETSPMTEEDPVRVSEVLLDNAYSIIDEYGDRSPWVELHNYSDNAVDLSYYYLSDNQDNLTKWRLPDKQLAPGEFMVIFLSGQDAELHTGFRVSKDEPIILTDFSTNRTQMIEIPNENRLKNISYGEQDGDWLYFGQPTPNAENSAHGSQSISSVEKLDSAGVWINEVLAVSMPRAAANNVDGRDWIELYNGSDNVVDLTGWHLGKNVDEPFRCELSGTIAPKSYKVFYADNSKYAAAGSLKMNVSMTGDKLVLSNSSKEIVDVFNTGALRYGLTSGRMQDDYSGDRYFFTSATPRASNSQPVSTYSAAPVFSHTGGFYTDSLTLEITGENIYYTTDGSTPDKSSEPYTGPIEINKSMVVSAVSIEDGKLTSDKVVATYLFEQLHTLPVVCITAKPSDYAAVYAQSSKFDPIVERAAYLEYYEPDGKLGTSFPAGIRVAGASTRVYRQKSLNIYLRGGYGQSSVVYPFFEDYSVTEYKSLALRAGGQDNSNSTSTYITDAYCSMLAKKFDTDYAESKYAILYVNGSYRGVYELKENTNEDSLAARHGVKPDDINLIRRNSVVLHGNNEQFLWAQAYARNNDLNNPANYEEFTKYVDVDAFIDHIFLQSYIGNADTFNQKYWATEDYSVKIRPIIFDLDFGYFRYNIIYHYFSGQGMQTPDGTHTNMWIPTGLKKSEVWLERLYERWAYHLTNTTNDRLELFDSIYTQMEPEMQRHCSYWKVFSYSTWKSNNAELRKRIEGRNEVFKNQMQKYFGLSDAKMAELFSND